MKSAKQLTDLSAAMRLRLLLVIAFVIAPHILHQPPQISLWIALGLGWQFLHLKQRLPAPPRWLLILLMLGGTALVWLSQSTIIGRDGGVSFILMLTALKLLEARNARDVRIVALLGLFLLFTLFLFDQSPFTALWSLVSFVLLLSLFSDLAHDGQPQPLLASLRSWLTPLGLSLPLALILFILVPRPNAPLFGLPQSNQATTGLSDELSPGSISQLSRSPDLAFRATFDGVEPRQNQLYWRGPVFVGYDGLRWSRLPQEVAPLDAPSSNLQPQGEVLHYSMMLEASHGTILPALDRPLNVPAGTHRLKDFSLRFKLPQDARQLIQLSADPTAQLDLQLSDELHKLSLQQPAGANPLLQDLGASWRTLPPQGRIQHALAYFHTEKFSYTLEPPALDPQDGMDDFLFNTRAGFCEHYATSFVLLMRAAGLPARVVTGYQGGEHHPDDYWIVRQGDAHAWAEVWLDGQGWVRIDPTASVAPERIEHGAAAAVPATADQLPAALRRDFGFLHRAKLQWDGLENRWNRWVLGYDASDQQQLLRAIGWLGEQNLRLWGLVALVLFISFVALKLIQHWYARPKLAIHQRLWQDFQKQLHTHGVETFPNEAPRALDQRIQRQRPDLASAVHGFIDSYLHWCYAAGNKHSLDHVKHALHELEKSRNRPHN
jgi:transglutaminase-like putative cysteine protease